MSGKVLFGLVLSVALVGPASAATVAGASVANLTTATVKSGTPTKVGTVKIGQASADVLCKAEGKGFVCHAVKADGAVVKAARPATLVQRKEGFELRVPLEGDLTITLAGVGAAAIDHGCCTIIYGDGSPPETQCPCKV